MGARRQASLLPVPSQPAIPVATPAVSRAGPMPLWCCLHCPELPLEVFAGQAVERASLLVHDHHPSRPRVVQAGRAAMEAGVRPGMSLVAAEALFASGHAVARRPREERQWLARLATRACRFSSQVSLVAPDAVLLEVGASLRLFGGLDVLLKRLETALAGQTVVRALAPTPLAATWLARAGQGRVVSGRGRLVRALSALPIAVLTADAGILASLRGMGLERVGDLLRLPRDGLARRFSPALLADLDRALGRQPDPRPAYRPPESFEHSLALALPARRIGHLQPALDALLDDLADWLRLRDCAVARLALLFHGRSETLRRQIGLARPEREPARLHRVLRQRLEGLRLAEPVEAVTLVSEEITAFRAASEALFPDPDAAEQAFDALLLQLRERLGEAAVRGLCLVEDYRPERAWRWCEPGDRGEVPWQQPHRPLWLLPEPQPLPVRAGRPWRNGPLRLRPLPLRVEAGWWDEGDVRRDYFMGEAPDGGRCWVFRVPGGHWFLHGLFG